MKNITIGADPELFMVNGPSPRFKAVSAHGVIPGTKAEPFNVDCGAVQVDGMALEFNINPAKNSDEFVFNINKVQEELRKLVPSKFYISPRIVTHFSKDYLDTQPPEAKELGCDPDYCAYTGEEKTPDEPEDLNFRCASGHIHIGWRPKKDYVEPFDPLHFSECRAITKELDIALGLPSILVEPQASGKKRRTLYGQAGSFRPKPYGLEYRVLSNFWLKDERYMRWVFENTQRVIENFQNQEYALRDDPYVATVINRARRNSAQEIIRDQKWYTRVGVHYASL